MAGPGPKNMSFRRPKSAKKTLLRIMGYLAKRKWQVLLVICFVMISSGANIFGTYMIKPIINECIAPWIGKGEADFTLLIKMLSLLGAVYLSGAVSSYLYSRIMLSISHGTLNAIRKDLFNKLQDLPVKFFDTHTHGELMSRFTNDVDTLREAISQGVTQFINSIASVTGTFVMMLVLSPTLTLLIVIMLVVMLFVIKVIGGKSAGYFKAQQKSIGAANGYIEEMVEGQKVVKVFCHEEKITSDFAVLNENLRIASTNAHTFASIIMPIMGNLSYLNYAVTSTAGAFLAIKGVMDIGTIGSFLQYTRSFSQPITQISQQFNSILSALAGAERIFDVMDRAPETDEGDTVLVTAEKTETGELKETKRRTGVWAWKTPDKGGFRLTEVLGKVEFHNVSFSYDGKKTVLKNVSLYAKPGQKIAFVGSTGAGKTTITNLINRFYDIDEGTITYDGIDIKRIKKDDLRRSLAMVLQDTHLFTGTVRENIRYGKLDATDEEIYAAARLANADSFIKHLKNGYDTMLTSDGANLSQGQRQLLAIARAAVADPPVLILDEATSSIDTRTEALIEKGMDSLMKGRTVFVIAHRLSTVRNSNAIMVLENGEIIERGDHDELLEQKGKYYQLYTGQFELS